MRAAIGLFAAVLLAGTALSQISPAPSTPPAPPADAGNGGMVTSINASSVKALFDAAGVQAEIKTTDSGYSYIYGQPSGFPMYVFPANCEGGDSLNGKCPIVVIESGALKRQLTAVQVNAYNQNITLANAMLYEGGSGPVIEYAFSVADGVGPNYLRSAFKTFTNEMSAFASYAKSVTETSSSTPAPAPGGFSAVEADPGLGGDFSTERSGDVPNFNAN